MPPPCRVTLDTHWTRLLDGVCSEVPPRRGLTSDGRKQGSLWHRPHPLSAASLLSPGLRSPEPARTLTSAWGPQRPATLRLAGHFATGNGRVSSEEGHTGMEGVGRLRREGDGGGRVRREGGSGRAWPAVTRTHFQQQRRLRGPWAGDQHLAWLLPGGHVTCQGPTGGDACVYQGLPALQVSRTHRAQGAGASTGAG